MNPESTFSLSSARGFLAAAAAALLVVVSAGPSQAITASSADDVCAPTDDPCVVTQSIEFVNGSVLDFGVRELQITGNGTFDVGAGSGEIRAGNIVATVGNSNAFLAKGADGFGGVAGGFLIVRASRGCSGNASVPCQRDENCSLGTCAVRTCSANANRDCIQDADCNLGVCTQAGRCQNNGGFTCQVDADCNLGQCNSHLSCSARREQACNVDADCEVGMCTVGTAGIDLDGRIGGSADPAASLILQAADDVIFRRLIDLNGTTVDTDGGELDAQSTFGTIQVEATFDMKGGSLSGGGVLDLSAGEDVLINSVVDANGGDFDGGTVEMEAGRDIQITNDLRANSTNGEGSGGFIAMVAGRDARCVGNGPSNKTNLGVDGHFFAQENFGGDGGTVEFETTQDTIVDQFCLIKGHGARPDALGADIFVASDRDVILRGEIDVKAEGQFGTGGGVQLQSARDIHVEANGVLDQTGGDEGGGLTEFLPNRHLIFDGEIDISGSQDGFAGAIFVDAPDGDCFINGEVIVNGGPGQPADGDVQLQCCRVDVSGEILNDAEGGENEITVGESMIVRTGALVRADASTGTNEVFHRDPVKPPVVQGTVTPAADVFVNEFLRGCPVCGNGEIDATESCDDGNTVSGDGCSSDCQHEDCVAATPGYPGVPICDDGNGCTVDSCDGSTGTCVHESTCDDGIDCTIESCVNDQCVSTPSDMACDDGNACTNDLCTQPGGCVTVNTTDTCDDGNFCTINDTCASGNCVGEANPCDDGVACTTGTCDNTNSVCIQTANDGLCDDGLFCNGAEVCDVTGGCSAGTVVDCSGLDGACVTGVCDDSSDACVTDNATDGTACDDGDVCTTGDQCTGGVCSGSLVGGCLCGNNTVDSGEDCDDGDSIWNNGEFCQADCTATPCGRPVSANPTRPSTTDALYSLRAAVGQASCDVRVCDVDGSGSVSATDSLITLKAAVGTPTTYLCPS